MYTKEAFIRDSLFLFGETRGNTVEIPGRGNVDLYELPLIGFADAGDELFRQYKQPEIIGTNFLTPVEWLPTANTVVSFFLPFTEKVRSSNRTDRMEPSPEWLYGRIEGQAFITQFMTGVRQWLEERGIDTCVPSQDERFGISFETTSTEGEADFHADSSWSERHANLWPFERSHL